MDTIKGTWKNGHVILDQSADWPDGSRVQVELVDQDDFVTEEGQGDDPESIARWLEWYDSLEPLIITPEEEADLAAWRQKTKDYTITKMKKTIDGLFP